MDVPIEVEQINPRPGDTIFVKVPDDTTQGDMAKLSGVLTEWSKNYEDIHVIVIPKSVTFETITLGEMHHLGWRRA